MSFILTDKNILKLIYKLAAEPEIPRSIPRELVDKIFDNLQKSSPDQFSQLSGESGWDKVNIPKINSLKSLINFLNQNNVSYQNKKIVKKILEISDEDEEYYKKYEKNFVLIDGIKAYITYLTTSPDYKKDPVYRELLRRLITQAKDAFGIDIEIPEYSNDLIFSFKQEIDLSKPVGLNKGDKELFVNDLDDLSNWITLRGIIFTGVTPDINDNPDKVCQFLNYLYKQPLFEKFKKNIEQSAQKYNCKIDGASSTQTAPSTGAPSGSASPSLGTASPNARAIMAQIKSMMEDELAPFYRDKDEIIFEIGRRGIIPFLELVKSLNLSKINSQCDDLIGQFNTIRQELESPRSFVNSTPISNQYKSQILITQLRGTNPQTVNKQFVINDMKDFLESKANFFIGSMENLHSLCSQLCDILQINENVRGNLKYYKSIKQSFISTKFNWFESHLQEGY